MNKFRYFLLSLKSIAVETEEKYILRASLAIYVSQLVNIEKARIMILHSDLGRSRSVEKATKIAQLNNLKFLSFCGNISFAPFIDVLSVSQSLEELSCIYVNLEKECTTGNFVKGLDEFPKLKKCEKNFSIVYAV